MKRNFFTPRCSSSHLSFFIVNSSTSLLEIINEAQNIGVLILLIMLHKF